MKKSISISILMAFTLFAAIALNANAVTVKDAPSCKDWNPHEVGYEMWIEGFLSGIAMERRDDFLARVGLKDIVKWVNDYCIANPKGEVTVAGVQLSLELMNGHSPATH